MAKEDLSKMDYYFKMNIYDFLNHLCYLQDKKDNTKDNGNNPN